MWFEWSWCMNCTPLCFLPYPLWRLAMSRIRMWQQPAINIHANIAIEYTVLYCYQHLHSFLSSYSSPCWQYQVFLRLLLSISINIIDINSRWTKIRIILNLFEQLFFRIDTNERGSFRTMVFLPYIRKKTNSHFPFFRNEI